MARKMPVIAHPDVETKQGANRRHPRPQPRDKVMKPRPVQGEGRREGGEEKTGRDGVLVGGRVDERVYRRADGTDWKEILIERKGRNKKIGTNGGGRENGRELIYVSMGVGGRKREWKVEGK